jgi:predicted HAD superfamily hydrolase
VSHPIFKPIRQTARGINLLGSMTFRAGNGLFSQLHRVKKLRGPRQIRMVIRSPARLRGFLLDNLDRFDVISFDVFDTLLERRIEPPDLVKEQSAAFLSKFLPAYDILLDPDDILARRKTIETRLRRLAVEEGFDAECEFAVLAEELIADCTAATASADIKKEIVDAFVRQELQLEQQALAPNPEMAGLFKELLRKNKRVILSSDMYLSADQIRNLLSANGLPAHDVPLYVSSELKVCKGTGRLFRRWIESEHVDPHRAIHIGDNAECDYIAALAVGLSAIHFADPASQGRRERLLKLHHTAASSDIAKGKYALALCENFKSHPLNGNFFFRYGSQFLGPVFAVAMHRLVEQVREYGIHQLLFAAREGFVFKNIYERFAQSLIPHAQRPNTVYAYFSRQSTALASVQRLSPREVQRGVQKMKQGGLAKVLSLHGLPQEPFATIAAEYGISLNDPIGRTDEPRLSKFLSDSRVQSAVAPLQRSAAAKLEAYLAQCGFWGRNRKVGLVDVGWEGTIQFNLINAFGQRQDFPQLFGFYLGRRRGPNLLDYSPSFAEGLLYDYRNYSIAERLPLEFLEIFEEAARAPHGTAMGYRLADSNDTVRPILKQPGQADRDFEIQNNPQLAVLQEGILDFAERYLEAVRWTGYGSEQIKPFVLATATRFVCLPRKNEVRTIIRHLKHAEDFGAGNSHELGLHKFNPLRLGDWKKVRRAFWRQGSLCQTSRVLAWLATIGRMTLFGSW